MSQIDNDIQAFFGQIEAEIADVSYDPEDGRLRQTALGKVILSFLEETGLINAAQPAYYLRESPRGNAEVHAYSIDVDEDLLTLFYLHDAQNGSPLPVTKTDVETAYRRLRVFARHAAAGELDSHVEPSQPVSELVGLLKEAEANHVRLQFSVITNGVLSDRAAGPDLADGEERDTWDLLRLFRTFGAGIAREPINISFASEYGAALPCLVTPVSGDGLQILLTCIPGLVLAKIYERYRARLLERNVRSFLQFTGKVNRGIRQTILDEPSRFLPYNNGIAATASSVVLKPAADGLATLESVAGFQIVNGGQTTASLASCLRRDKAELSSVLVQMKLTVVPPDKIDGIVPLISRYANTQNRVQEADFSANHPYHIELEKLSRQTWTRPTPQVPRGTRWFYERSRGQYAVEKFRNATSAGQRRFSQENPSPQRFSKTDLAKYLMSWDQFPQRVSLGAQKNFLEFMHLVERENRPVPDEAEFHRIVGLAMLYRRAEHLYGELGYTGYRANVVAYVVALLSHRLQRHFDWSATWDRQEIAAEVVEMMKPLIIAVRNAIVTPPGQQNITEWCKKDACWSTIVQMSIEAPGLPEVKPPVVVVVDGTQQKLIDAVSAIPASIWLEVAAWAKRTDSLASWQRGISYSVGQIIARNRKPSFKQASQSGRLLEEAWRLGFRHNDLTDPLLAALRASRAVISSE